MKSSKLQEIEAQILLLSGFEQAALREWVSGLPTSPNGVDLSDLAGSVTFAPDGLEYQKRERADWS